MANKSDVVFACVKPHLIQGALRECADAIADKLVVSVAAGVTIENLESVSWSSYTLVNLAYTVAARLWDAKNSK